MKKELYYPNVRGWRPTEQDYVLVFMPVNGVWIELSHDISKYANISLADFLADISVFVPDYTQFLRVIDDERGLYFEYRSYDALRIVVRVCWR